MSHADSELSSARTTPASITMRKPLMKDALIACCPRSGRARLGLSRDPGLTPSAT